jgi:TrmH family RNA methyltransferase
MLTKNKIKFIQSLVEKKSRKENGLFVVEGEKMATEVLFSDLKVTEVYAVADWFEDNELFEFYGLKEIVSEDELKKISQLITPNKVLLIVKIPEYKMELKNILNNFVLGLDNLQDPGNLGAIIRTADWFGIKDIFCSSNSVDAYNPKVVSATMGAVARVRVHYVDLPELVNKIKKQDKNYPVYGAMMDGKSVYEEKFLDKGIIIFGNESQGISAETEKIIDQKITIPRAKNSQAESLNVAMAVGVVCSCVS